MNKALRVLDMFLVKRCPMALESFRYDWNNIFTVDALDFFFKTVFFKNLRKFFKFNVIN